MFRVLHGARREGEWKSSVPKEMMEDDGQCPPYKARLLNPKLQFKIAAANMGR